MKRFFIFLFFCSSLIYADHPSIRSSHIIQVTRFLNISLDQTETFSILVVGDFPLYEMLLKQSVGKAYKNIPIQVLYSEDQISKAHLIYLSGTNSDVIKKQIKNINKKETIIITKIQKGICLGADLNFDYHKDRLIIESSNKINKKRNIHINSRLKGISRIIDECMEEQ